MSTTAAARRASADDAANIKHAGMQACSTFSGKDGSYDGKITDPDAKKTYSGSITATGNAVKLKGCVLKVVCESQTWTRL